MRHPQVIPGSQRPYGATPTGSPLHRWAECYPDESIRHFREIWVQVRAVSGTVYGGIQVQEIQP